MKIMRMMKSHPAFTCAQKFAAAIPMVIALTFSAYAQSNDVQPNHGQSEPKVPFDLEKFQPVLSQSRLHSPRTRIPIAVSSGKFGGYELPDRFYLGEDGTTMVIATTSNNRDRSEVRHNAIWSLMGEEKRLSARLRFDKPVALGGMRSRLNVVQIYMPGQKLGPLVLVQWVGSREADGNEDRLSAFVQGSKDTNYDLAPRPDGFFDLDVSIEEGKVRIHIDNELKLEEDLSTRFKEAKAYFKTGAYHRGIEAHAVEFESLTITTP